MLQADSSRSDSTLVSRSVIALSCPRGSTTNRYRRKTTMFSFKVLAAAVLLSAAAATPAFAQNGGG
jgi:hypothetical protein